MIPPRVWSDKLAAETIAIQVKEIDRLNGLLQEARSEVADLKGQLEQAKHLFEGQMLAKVMMQKGAP